MRSFPQVHPLGSAEHSPSGISAFNVELSNHNIGVPLRARTTTYTVPHLASGFMMHIEGATSEVRFNLSPAIAGPQYSFCCNNANGMRIYAAAGDTIRVAGSVSAVAGYIQTATVGNVITLKALNAVEWFAIAVVGSWNVN